MKLYVVITCYERQLELLGVRNTEKAAKSLLKRDFMKDTGITKKELKALVADDGNYEMGYQETSAWANLSSGNCDWQIFEIPVNLKKNKVRRITNE